jgi:hypothetical protein
MKPSQPSLEKSIAQIQQLQGLFGGGVIVNASVSESSIPWGIYLHCSRLLTEEELIEVNALIKSWETE